MAYKGAPTILYPGTIVVYQVFVAKNLKACTDDAPYVSILSFNLSSGQMYAWLREVYDKYYKAL